MKTAFGEAIALILSGNEQLANIIGVTFRMGFSSSLIALLFGIPLGFLLGTWRWKGKNILVIINRTFMALPPVVCGLICYILFSGVGPMRHYKLLYTVKGMIIAQVILLTPLATGNLESHISSIAAPITATARGLKLGRLRTMFLFMGECRYQIVSTYLFLLGRSFAEVGAISMVGGAIAYKTNVMTTAIMNYSNMGNITIALALGIILLGISLVLNTLVSVLYLILHKAG